MSPFPDPSPQTLAGIGMVTLWLGGLWVILMHLAPTWADRLAALAKLAVIASALALATLSPLVLG